MKTLTIVIPVYNEQSTVSEVVEKVLATKLPGLNKEIIVVNDGSTDKTGAAIDKIQRDHNKIKVHNLLINLGKGAAVRTGLSMATGDIIIIQDADLELDPAEYKNIIEPILSGKSKVVYGSRFLRSTNRISLKTRMANFCLTALTNLLFGSKITDMETAYKAFTKEVLTFLNKVKLKSLEFEFEPEITAQLLKHHIKILEVPIAYNPRTVTEGKKMRVKDGIEAIYTLLRCRFW